MTFLLMVPIASSLYLAIWTGWFATDGGYYRHWAEEAGNAWQGVLAWVPHGLQSLWHYHQPRTTSMSGCTPHGYAGEPADLAAPDPADPMYYRGYDRAGRMRGDPLRGLITSWPTR